MKTETKPIVGITQILTHARAHFDELVAWLLLIWYGKQLFPGIERAKLFFAGATTEGPDEMFDAQGIIRIACGGRFDEHIDSGSGRIPGKCAAILVAEYLGINELPHFKRLLTETLECDERNVSATRFPQIMKAAYRAFPNDPAFIMTHSKLAVHAIIKAEMCKFAPKANEPTLTSLFERVLKERAQHFTDERINEHIKRLFAESDKAGEEFVTELSFIVKAMSRRDDPIDDIFEWVLFVSKILYADQVAFQVAKDFCKAKAQEFSVDVAEGPRLRLGVVRTDLDCVLQAMLYFKYDIVLIQNSKGQVQICTSKKMRSRGFRVTSIVEMWRWLELSPEGKRRFRLSELGMAGNHPGVNNIYYHCGDEENPVENIYNGTTTHPNVRSTQVALQAIVEIIQHGFTDWGMDRWADKWVAVRRERREKQVAAQKPKPIVPVIIPSVETSVEEVPLAEMANAPVAPTTDVGEAFEKAEAGK